MRCYELVKRRNILAQSLAVQRGAAGTKKRITTEDADRVHWFRMKNVTLSADADLIEQARAVARGQHKTLNAAFREWLEQYTAQSGSAQAVDTLMKRLSHVRAGRHFMRDEMHER